MEVDIKYVVENKLTIEDQWKLLVECLKQKAIARYGNKFIRRVSEATGKPYRSVKHFLDKHNPPSLATYIFYCNLLSYDYEDLGDNICKGDDNTK